MRLLSLLITLIAVAACRSAQKGIASLAVAGGEVAVAGQFPATVAIAGCTATKIGARTFLTAAHCVMDDRTHALDAEFRVGATAHFYYGVQLPSAVKIPLTIDTTRVHTSYLAALDKKPLGEALKLDDKIIDLAVINVAEATPAVAVAMLSDRQPTLGLGMILGGYGCEYDFVKAQVDEAERRKNLDNFGDSGTFTAQARAVDDRRLKWTPFQIGAINDAVFKLIFKKFPNEMPKACPGDSGGAVYINDLRAGEDPTKHKFLEILGVNSRIGPLENVFIRLDDSAGLTNRTCILQGSACVEFKTPF